MRHEHCHVRVLRQLCPDGVRLRRDEREPLTAIEVCSLDAFQERVSLFGHGVPAQRVILQLTDFVERLPDRLRNVVEHADDVDRCLDDGLRLFPETLLDQNALLLRQRRDVIDLRPHSAQLRDDRFGGQLGRIRGRWSRDVIDGITHDISSFCEQSGRRGRHDSSTSARRPPAGSLGHAPILPVDVPEVCTHPE